MECLHHFKTLLYKILNHYKSKMSNCTVDKSGRHNFKYIIKVNIMNNETNQNHGPPERNITSFL